MRVLLKENRVDVQRGMKVHLAQNSPGRYNNSSCKQL
jgi:hypothetical protein